MQSLNTNPVREDMQQRIEQFAGQVVTDLAAAMAGVMTNLGHKLGLYRAMAESGPINSGELASRTATNERSVREWLNGQVAGGYVSFHSSTNEYSLPPEHAFVLAGLPYVVQRPQAEIEIDARGDGEFEVLHFLRLKSIGAHPDLVESR